ncbi:MAG: magnesium/cobalt transporter CorA [Bacteroidota bacterium]
MDAENKDKTNPTGLPPGEVVFTGDRKVDEIRTHYLEYDAQQCKDVTLDSESVLTFHKPVKGVNQWYDIRGLHDVELIKAIGKTFQLHPLVLEDIANIFERPKVDEFEDALFISLKAISYNPKDITVHFEQIGLYYTHDFLLSFQEDDEDLFANVRHRVNHGLGRVRKKGHDYLVYALIDTLTDQYLEVMEQIEDEIEAIEEEIVKHPKAQTKTKIYHLKQELNQVRKAVMPLREISFNLLKLEEGLLSDEIDVYLRDLKDHCSQLVDQVDTCRDDINGLQDLFLSEMSHQMNLVVQTLTIVSTIFIPLSFLAGLYGMNFQHMPELAWRNGYFYLLGLMAIITLGLLLYFKRKKWL